MANESKVNPPHETVNLAVDVQFGTDPAFIERVRNSADILRQQGIPTIWITMDNRSQLYPPLTDWPSASPATRDMAQLKEQGFFGHGPGTTDAELKTFADHFQVYGPRTDEAVFPKAFFNAFASRPDLSRPDMRDFFTSQRQPEHAIDIDKAFIGPALQDYLKDLGVKNVTIMGGNADVCVTETAMGAAKNGFNATILTDHIVSHTDPRGNKPPAEYENELRALHARMLDSPQELAVDANHPTKAGYASGTIFSDADKTLIKNNVHTDTLQGLLSKTQPQAAPPVPAAPRAFGGGVGIVMGSWGLYQSLRLEGPLTPSQKMETAVSAGAAGAGVLEGALAVAKTAIPQAAAIADTLAPYASRAGVAGALGIGALGVIDGALTGDRNKIVTSVGSTATAFAGAEAGAAAGALVAGPYGAIVGGVVGGAAAMMGFGVIAGVRPMDLTSEQKSFFSFFDDLPAKTDASMGPEMRRLVEAKANILQAQSTYDRAVGGMLPTIANERAVLEKAENSFADTFDGLVKDGGMKNAVAELMIRKNPEAVAAALITPAPRNESRPPMRSTDMTPQVASDTTKAPKRSLVIQIF